MIPSDTLLASFVRSFGDHAMSFILDELYRSNIYKFIFLSSSVAFFFSIAFSVYNRKFKGYWITFLIIWFLAYPVNGKPPLYRIMDSFSSMVGYELQKVSRNLLTKFGTSTSSYPPGFVVDTVIKAGTMEINDSTIVKAVSLTIDNCIPFGEVEGIDGKMRAINAADLFRVKKHGHLAGTLVFEWPFDKSKLRNRRFKVNHKEVDCYEFTTDTVTSVYDYFQNRSVLASPRKFYVGWERMMRGENSPRENISWVSGGIDENSDFSKFSLNLAAANATQRIVYKKYFGTEYLNDYSRKTSGSSASIDNMILEGSEFNTGSKFLYNIMNLPSAVLRYFNADNVFSRTSSLVDLNEQLQRVPYYISIILVFLKIIFPIVVITPFVFSSWRIVTMWFIAYFFSHVIPWVMMISRSICNIIILHAVKIGNSSELLDGQINQLNYGIDFFAASKMLEDTSKFLSTYVDIELKLWMSLGAVVPILSFFAARPVSQFGSAVGGVMMSSATRLIGGSVVGKTVSLASGLGKTENIRTEMPNYPERRRSTNSERFLKPRDFKSDYRVRKDL